METVLQDKQLRTFGLLVGGIFLLIGLWPVLLYAKAARLWAAIPAGFLMLLALIFPKGLKPIYRMWMAIGLVLGTINTKIILGIIFFGLFTPLGIVRRVVFSKDSMQRRFEPETETYRVVREPRSSVHLKRPF